MRSSELDLVLDLGAVLLGGLAPDLAASDPGGGHLDPARAWASSGGLWLTGDPAGCPSVDGAGAGAVAEHLVRVIRRLALQRGVPGAVLAGLPTVAVLGERAAWAGLTRHADRSCGGASRLLATTDGHVVLTLARSDDLELVPALVADGPAPTGDPWEDVAAWARRTATAEAAARIELLGLPGGAVSDGSDGAAGPAGPAVCALDGGVRTPRERPRVLDLSSLWAGPLCAQVLGLIGADVVKVESSRRPDGTRRGCTSFYDLLHAGHRSVVLDFTSPRDLDRLHRLAESADVVIEASRPRALARLGLDAERLVASGVTWVSVTAHGRGSEGAERVGFGDDVAAGAGLLGAGPVFIADAVADPLTGLAAAAGALAGLAGPRALLLDVAMDRVAACAAAVPDPGGVVHDVDGGWVLDTGSGVCPVSRPRGRAPCGTAPAAGRDTHDVLAEWLG